MNTTNSISIYYKTHYNIFLYLMCFISFSVIAQNNSINKTQIKEAKNFIKSNLPIKAITALNKISKPDDPYIFYLYGISYGEINNYNVALQNFDTAKYLLLKKKELNNNENKLLIRTIINLSFLILKFNDLHKFKYGIKVCKYGDSIVKNKPIKWQYKYLLKINLASLYNQVKHLDIIESSKYYLEALSIAAKENDSTKLSHVLLQLGNLYNTTNYNKSIYYLDEALVHCQEIDTSNLKTLYFNYSMTYAYNKEYAKSINSINRSFKYLLGNNFKNKFLNKKIKNKDYRLLIYMLPSIAETYSKYYEETKDIELLNKSIEYYKLADYVLDLVKNNSSDFKSKLFWQEMSSEIYSKAIKTCYLNNNINDAWYFMEKNKTLLLMEDIANQNYKLSLNIPKDLLQKENSLKKRLISINNNLKNDKFNKDSIIKLRLDNENELQVFQDSIYNTNRQIKNITEIQSIKTIQHYLLQNEVFIEYHVSNEASNSIFESNKNGYAIFITKNNVKFIEIQNLKLLKTQIKNLIRSYKTPFINNDDVLKFEALSFKVFNKLFPTEKIKELIKNKKLTIAPDNYLSLLPFETLITSQTESKKLNYLIKYCEISYVYSYSFEENNKLVVTNNSSVLAIAPIKFRANYATLVNSKKEVEQISNYFNSTVFINAEATKKNFTKELPKHNIIHLATHANSKDSINPWIAFYDKKITLPELYLEKNNASLVVLSACNTTLGKQEIGEGVMSLARGFFSGGAQSIVSSLWSVDDTSTPYIMSAFYKNLHNKQTKSKALHNAKLQYLENHSFSELSPHFWASFILLGKNDVVNVPFNYKPYVIISLILLLFLLGLYFYKRKK